ncbi:uncharacterized protein MYCFIDRAFT_171771 [Pseudocercospora fijiensis CIRAD86]|uniref:Uncharacterized protein n=1 Tax=Pseudocercospora fijiensis (strain CIRAD86) TaxID=383855 RepID=M3AMV8_PSEFD|nr:uncharacterized protein MYCFIDRAFT_171771 [Pseudocercospora fijiensis CIRAD86]EME85931.1 hypothetical protein MYCFIDRAFT_171771 [Pseudocercospora fijiensis CIRAD86]
MTWARRRMIVSAFLRWMDGFGRKGRFGVRKTIASRDTPYDKADAISCLPKIPFGNGFVNCIPHRIKTLLPLSVSLTVLMSSLCERLRHRSAYPNLTTRDWDWISLLSLMLIWISNGGYASKGFMIAIETIDDQSTLLRSILLCPDKISLCGNGGSYSLETSFLTRQINSFDPKELNVSRDFCVLRIALQTGIESLKGSWNKLRCFRPHAGIVAKKNSTSMSESTESRAWNIRKSHMLLLLVLLVKAKSLTGGPIVTCERDVRALPSFAASRSIIKGNLQPPFNLKHTNFDQQHSFSDNHLFTTTLAHPKHFSRPTDTPRAQISSPNATILASTSLIVWFHTQLSPPAYRSLCALLECAEIADGYEDGMLTVCFNGAEIVFADKMKNSTVIFAKPTEPSDVDSKGGSKSSSGGSRSDAKAGKAPPPCSKKGDGKGQDGGEGNGRRSGDPPTLGKVLRTPVNVKFDLPDMALGARELCCYFPHQSQWADYLIRLLRNGWKVKDIAKAQLFHRGELNATNLTRRHDALRHQVLVAGRDHYNDENWTTTRWLQASHADSLPFSTAPANGNFLDLYDVTTWTPRRGQTATGGYPTFEQIRQGVDVTREPTGEDAGVFTRTVQLVFANYDADWHRAHRIDEVPAIAGALSIQPTNEAQNTATWDQNALTRLNNNVAQRAAFMYQKMLNVAEKQQAGEKRWRENRILVFGFRGGMALISGLLSEGAPTLNIPKLHFVTEFFSLIPDIKIHFLAIDGFVILTEISGRYVKKRNAHQRNPAQSALRD